MITLYIPLSGADVKAVQDLLRCSDTPAGDYTVVHVNLWWVTDASRPGEPTHGGVTLTFAGGLGLAFQLASVFGGAAPTVVFVSPIGGGVTDLVPAGYYADPGTDLVPVDVQPIVLPTDPVVRKRFLAARIRRFTAWLRMKDRRPVGMVLLGTPTSRQEVAKLVRGTGPAVYYFLNLVTCDGYVGSTSTTSGMGLLRRFRTHTDLNPGARGSKRLKAAFTCPGLGMEAFLFVVMYVKPTDNLPANIVVTIENAYLNDPDSILNTAYNVARDAEYSSGWKHTPEALAKMRGRRVTPEVLNYLRNRPVSEYTRGLQRAAQLGRLATPQAKANMAAANTTRRPIIVTDLLAGTPPVYYSSIKAAATAIGVSQAGLVYAIKVGKPLYKRYLVQDAPKPLGIPLLRPSM